MTVPVRLPAATALVLAAPPAVPDALAVLAASRVSPPDDARRPVFEDVAEIDLCTFRWADAAFVELVAEVVDDACDDVCPDVGTNEAGPDATAVVSTRGGMARNDKELPDLEPSLSN